MPSRLRTVMTISTIMLGGALFPFAAGCRDSEPLPPFNYDLGDGTTHLLPTADSVYQGHDPGIVSRGNPRADIYHVGDQVAEEAPPPAAPVTGVAAPLPPAHSAAEALGNVGQAVFGNLFGGGRGAAVSTNGADGANEGDAAGGG